MRLEYILEQAINSGASDVHIVVGVPPTMRLNGELKIMEMDRLSADKAKDLVWGFMTPDQAALFQKDREMNLSFNIPGLSYFRMNLYYRMGNVEAAIRIIPLKIPSLNELGLPSIVGELTRRKSGLILITGSAGMGKTTTMAAMINLLNQEERHARVLTIEDPIEYVHPVINSIIIQREIGRDTKSFEEGLRQALRQDPNWICIGEMRDLDTINIALTAAETGHLVLATLHSPDTVISINRILDGFSKEYQNAVRMQLATVLEGVISQRLLPRLDGKGRVLALEILIATIAVRNIIRGGDIPSINGYFRGTLEHGMVGLDQSLADLYLKGEISYETAAAHAKDIKHFKALTKT